VSFGVVFLIDDMVGFLFVLYLGCMHYEQLWNR